MSHELQTGEKPAGKGTGPRVTDSNCWRIQSKDVAGAAAPLALKDFAEDQEQNDSGLDKKLIDEKTD